jgi:hypothetical protein
MILVLFILGCLFGVLALAAWAADRTPAPARPDRRLSAREMELVGTDWRDSVQHLFEGQER